MSWNESRDVVCTECGRHYDEVAVSVDEEYTVALSFCYEDCPECGGELVDAVQCPKCERWIAKQDSVLGDGEDNRRYCEECWDKIFNI